MLTASIGVDNRLDPTKIKIPDLYSQLGIEIMNIEAGWDVNGKTSGGQSLVTPEVRLTLKNVSKHELRKISAQADFKNLDKNESMGSATSSMGYEETIKPGEQIYLDIEASRGFYQDYFFNPPQVSAGLKINGVEIGSVKINSADRQKTELSK